MTGTSRYSMAASEMNFRDLLQVLGRHRFLLAAHIVAGLILAFLMSYFGPEKWEANSQVEIQGRTQSSPGVVGGDPLSLVVARPSDFDILTEIAVLRFPDMYYAVLQRLGRTPPQNRRDFEQNYPQVRIEQESTSKVVQISVTAPTEKEATDFANTLPLVYKEAVDSRNKERLETAIRTVDARVKATTREIEAVVKKLAGFRRQNAISVTQESEDRSFEARSAESLYFQAVADAAAAESRLRQLKADLAAIPVSRTETIVETNRAQIEGEKTNLQSLKALRADLLTKFKADHPRVKAADTRIEEQEKYIASLPLTSSVNVTRPNPEIDQHKEKIRNAEAELDAARAKEARYKIFLAEKKAELQVLGDTTEEQFAFESKLNRLQRTLDGQEKTLDELKLRNNPDLESPIRIMTAPTELASQVAPRWTVNLLLGAGLGFMLGIFVAIARELTLDKVNYPAEAVNVAGADVLARIPIRPKSRAPLIEDPQTARAFEAYRLLRAGMIMRLQQVGQGAFIVTSTTKGEGKTVIAGNLGVAMALEGRTCCVVDCNLRDPKLHRLFRLENEMGVTDVLLARAGGLAEVCQETSVPNLRVVTAGTKLANPTEALASPEMLVFIENLKTQFDVVIFDCPDAYSVADTQELARQVRNVLYVVELGQTNKSRMEQALTFMRQASGRVLGLALNKDPQAKGRFV